MKQPITGMFAQRTEVLENVIPRLSGYEILSVEDFARSKRNATDVNAHTVRRQKRRRALLLRATSQKTLAVQWTEPDSRRSIVARLARSAHKSRLTGYPLGVTNVTVVRLPGNVARHSHDSWTREGQSQLLQHILEPRSQIVGVCSCRDNLALCVQQPDRWTVCDAPETHKRAVP